MKSFTNQSLLALAFVALLSSCSRPYATFQKTTPEHFYTKTNTMSFKTPAEAETPVVAQPAETVAVEMITPAAPASVDAELNKVEALVSTKAGLSTNKKLTRHLNHVKEMVTEMRAKVAAPASLAGTTATSVAPQKMNLVQRLVAKSIDKKIQKKLAPKQPMAATSILTVGAVLVIVGLVLLLATTSTGIGAGIALAGAIVLLIGLL